MLPQKHDTEILANCLTNQLGYIVPHRAVERSLEQYNNTLKIQGSKAENTLTNNVSLGTFSPTINVPRENTDTIKSTMLVYIIALTIYVLVTTLLLGIYLF